MEKRHIMHVSAVSVSGRAWLSLTFGRMFFEVLSLEIQPALLSHPGVISAFGGILDSDAVLADLT